MVYKNSFEYLQKNNPNIMAVALCEITLDNLANNLANEGENSIEEIKEIEAMIKGLGIAGTILCKDYGEKLIELRGIILREFHLNENNKENDMEGGKQWKKEN